MASPNKTYGVWTCAILHSPWPIKTKLPPWAKWWHSECRIQIGLETLISSWVYGGRSPCLPSLKLKQSTAEVADALGKAYEWVLDRWILLEHMPCYPISSCVCSRSLNYTEPCLEMFPSARVCWWCFWIPYSQHCDIPLWGVLDPAGGIMHSYLIMVDAISCNNAIQGRLIIPFCWLLPAVNAPLKGCCLYSVIQQPCEYAAWRLAKSYSRALALQGGFFKGCCLVFICSPCKYNKAVNNSGNNPAWWNCPEFSRTLYKDMCPFNLCFSHDDSLISPPFFLHILW